MSSVARRLLKGVKWCFIGVAGLLVLVVAAGNAYRLYVRHEVLKNTPAAAGRLVSIGTHRMHIYCEGDGRPTVVLDAGGGTDVRVWAAVMERAQAITRVCAFDRSGIGWSERSPVPVTRASRAADLAALLAASGEPGPYIFAGHSLGAEQAWLYAQDHLEQTAGLISVDGVPPNAREVGMGASCSADTSDGPGLLQSLGLAPLAVYLMGKFVPPLSTFPEEMKQRAVQVTAVPPGDDNECEFLAIADQMHEIGDVPLVVLSHGQPGALMSVFGPRAAEAEVLWQAGQARLSTLSSQGRLVVSEQSDHVIPVNDPAAVVAAIDDLVQRFRATSP